MGKQGRQGEAHWCSKVTERLAIEVRRNWGNLTIEQRHEFARLSGITYQHLRDIASGKRWKHLDEPVIFHPRGKGRPVGLDKPQKEKE